MTLPDQIRFVNDLIKENPEITIKEYLEDLKMIESIEKASEREEQIHDALSKIIRQKADHKILKVEPDEAALPIEGKRKSSRPPAQYSNHSPFGIAS